MLRLDQIEHFGAEIVAPVAPAQPPARHRAEAQMHTFDHGRSHPDFAIRFRRREILHCVGIDLERHVRLGAAIGTRLIIIGAPDRGDQQIEPAQCAVVVEADHFVQGRLEHELEPPGTDAAGFHAFRQIRIEARAEQRKDQRRDLGMARQRQFLRGLGWVEPGLLAIARQRPDQRRFAPGAGQREHEPVETVVLGPAGPDRGERGLEFARGLGEVDRLAVGGAGFDVVDKDAVRGTERPRL